MRWPAGPVCLHCGAVDEAVAISTQPGQYRCNACGKHYTVTVGTAMEGSHFPLHVRCLAMHLMLSTATPISAMGLSRQTGIQYRTCWHLPHRLHAMLAGGGRLPLAGVVEAAEIYVGSKVENLPKSAPKPERIEECVSRFSLACSP